MAAYQTIYKKRRFSGQCYNFAEILTLMSSTSSEFTFEKFAERIYRENPNGHRKHFLLPALYGGSRDQRHEPEKYDILFVFPTPSVPFTEKQWPAQCNNSDDAIQIHRHIFFNWAYTGAQAYLFNALYDKPDFEI